MKALDLFHMVFVVYGIIAFGALYFLSKRLAPRWQWIERFTQWLTPKKAFVILAVAIVLSSVCFSIISITLYNGYGMRIFDIGNMNQTIWNIVHGDPFRMTTFFPAENRMFMHVEPIFLALAPLYALWQDPRMLILIQVVLLGLGAIPVFLLARRTLNSLTGGVVFGVAYLLMPAIHQALLFEFHPLVLAVPFLLTAVYAYTRKQLSLSFIFFLAALLCREDIAFMVFLFGVVFLFGTHKRFGVVLCTTAVAWIAMVFGVIYPSFAITEQPLQFEFYSRFGSGPIQILLYISTHPQELIRILASVPFIDYLLFLLGPLAFLPVLRMKWLIPGLFSAGVIVLHTASEVFMVGHGQYHAPLVVPLSVAGIFGAAWYIQRHDSKVALRRIIILVLGMSVLFTMRTTLLYTHFRSAHLIYSEEKVAYVEYVSERIPDDASLVTSLALGSKLSGRKNLWLLYTPYRSSADVIFVSAFPEIPCEEPTGIQSGDIRHVACEGEPNEYVGYLNEVLENPDYELLEAKYETYVFKRKDVIPFL